MVFKKLILNNNKCITQRVGIIFEFCSNHLISVLTVKRKQTNKFIQMKLTVIKKLMLFAIATFSFHACMEDLDLSNIDKEFTVDQSLVLPIGETNLTLADILEQIDNDLINTDGTDIYVNFEDTLEWNYRVFDLLSNTLPMEKDFDLSPFVFTSPIAPNSQFEVPYSDELVPLNLNSNPADMRIDSITANSANLKIEIDKTDLNINPENIIIDIQFAPTDLKFLSNQTVVSHTPTAFGVAQNIPLTQFSIYTPNNASDLALKVRFRLNTGNVPVIIFPTSKISVKVSLADLDFAVAYGHFNPATNLSGITEEAEFDIDDVIPAGMIKPANPQLFLTAISNVGVSLNVKLDYIRALRKGDNAFTPVSAMFPVSGGPDSESFTQTINPAQLGFSVPTAFPIINSTFGKIDRLFDQDKYPNTFEYKYSLENVTDPRVPQFITPDAKLKIAYRLKVPLHAKAESYYELNDTIQDIGDGIADALENEFIDNAKLILRVKNGLPVKVELEIALLDENKQAITTDIKTNYNINVANIDAAGKVVASSIEEQRIIIEFTGAQLEALRNAKHLAYKVKVAGADAKAINFQTTDSFGIKAGVFVKAKTTVKLGENND